ncbi:MAG: DnaD domain protein [Chloroflexi bacterium]|nr:DnaD domain protein [Chloroflexota bacterium]
MATEVATTSAHNAARCGLTPRYGIMPLESKTTTEAAMSTFEGFPAGRLRTTLLPNLFFSVVLPQIDNLAELKVTLHVYWLLQQPLTPGRRWRAVRAVELAADATLRRSLLAVGEAVDDLWPEGLERAVARGTLLRLRLATEEREEDWYFLNDAAGRELVAKIKSGEIALQPGERVREAPPPGERPNIFLLYEQYIGLLSPMIAEELQEAEQLYPAAWIAEAFAAAAERGKRSWRYVRVMLERWRTEGKR